MELNVDTLSTRLQSRIVKQGESSQKITIPSQGTGSSKEKKRNKSLGQETIPALSKKKKKRDYL